ncbi:MAG: restriction endonuclease subunit [Frankiales bacterium]|nr:restriction endonuclease subunit [Frankiales bacterium]
MAVDFHTEGVPLIRLAGLKSGANLLAGCNYLDPVKVAKKWSHFCVSAGDVLLSTSASLGEVAVVRENGVGAIPYTGIIRFRPRDERVVPEFIPFALQSPEFKQQIAEMGVGSVMNHFGPSHLKHMTIRIPPVAQQRAIAEVLGALDDKIASNAALIETMDGLAAALTRSALSDDAATLGSIAQVTMGSSPPGTSYNTSGKGLVFYQGVTDFGVRTPSNRMWTDAPVRTVEQGDILVSVRAPVGRTNIASEPTCVGRGLAGVRSLIGRNHTLFHLLRDIPEAWLPFQAGGTIFGSISKPQLLGVRVPTVRPDLVDGLEEKLRSLETRVIAAIGEDVKLSELRDTLLPELMSGRLRVKDAERIVEGEA